MRYVVYCVLLSIAMLLAMDNAQFSGGFRAEFVILLVFIVLTIAVIEGACWTVWRIREALRIRADARLDGAAERGAIAATKGEVASFPGALLDAQARVHEVRDGRGAERAERSLTT
jgi:hypothetical protein